MENKKEIPPPLHDDPDLKRVRASVLRYHPTPILPSDCLPDAVLTLRGPRRAGKTVALKLLLADLLEQNLFSPENLIWRNFETLRSLEQIEMELQALCGPSSHQLIIIDEVTAVPDWQKALKKIKDEGFFRQSTIILTGSSAYDLKKGAERMAGRRGSVEHPDRTLLPMSFSEFERQLQHNQIRLGDDVLTQAYLTAGGFPFRVEHFIQSSLQGIPFNSEAGFQIFDDVIFYEINRRRLDRNIALEVIGRLSQIGSGAVSYDALSKPLSISRETLKRYLDAFGDSFLLATISAFDTARNRVAPKKDRKWLWVDPSLGQLAAWLGVGQPSDFPTRVEWAVGMELIRRHELRLFEGLSSPRNVFTWKSSSGNEIDFLVMNRATGVKIPVEVKYQNQITDWDFQVMERAFGSGVMVTKNSHQVRQKARALSLGQFLREPTTGK